MHEHDEGPKDYLFQKYGLMGQRGGYRPNAGRKKSSTKLQKEARDNLNQMVDARKLLFSQLYTEVMIIQFVEAIKNAIVSPKASDRTWAMRILASIYQDKGILPQEVVDPNEGKITLEDLLKEYKEKRSGGDLEGEAEVLTDDSGE